VLRSPGRRKANDIDPMRNGSGCGERIACSKESRETRAAHGADRPRLRLSRGRFGEAEVRASSDCIASRSPPAPRQERQPGAETPISAGPKCCGVYSTIADPQDRLPCSAFRAATSIEHGTIHRQQGHCPGPDAQRARPDSAPLRQPQWVDRRPARRSRMRCSAPAAARRLLGRVVACR
jgi:hypothetical protein